MALQVTTTAFAGSVWAETYTLTNPDGTPIDLTGLVFEFVIRPNTSDTTSPALVQVTSSSSNAQGGIAVTPLAGTVAVTLTPAATALLKQGARPYTLWSQPGTSSAVAWVTGTFNSMLVASA